MNRERRFSYVSSLALLAVIAGGCKSCPPPDQVTVDPKKAEEVRTALVEWFECEECEEGQLETVVKFQREAVPSLAATLREGPAPASVALLRDELEARYDKLVEYSKDHPEAKVASSKEEFVKMYLDNYEALYRTRAAQALGAIGGPAATKALESAAQGRSMREDVQREVEVALKKAQSTP